MAYSTLQLVALLNLVIMYKCDISGEYCDEDQFNATCPSHHVVMMKVAIYGRMKDNRCVTKDNCQADAMQVISRWCSGRVSCNRKVIDLFNANIKPCKKGQKNYLEATYSCVKALPESTINCEGPIVISSSQSPVYISSVLARRHTCPTGNKPLILKTTPGQFMSIRLLDFSSDVYGNSGRVYAVIRDPSSRKPNEIGPVRSNRQNHMTSQSNEVQIRIMANNHTTFLLEVNVSGCPDPILSSSTIFSRNQSKAEISCSYSKDIQVIKCVNGQWIGKITNCSENNDNGNTLTDASTMNNTLFSEEMSILIIAMVALLVGIFVLAIGVICLKRYTQQRIDHPVEAQEEYWPPPPHDIEQEVVYKPSDGNGLSNEYYRTWQLQQHNNTNPQWNRPLPPPYNTSNNDDNSNLFTDGGGGRFIGDYSITNSGQHHPIEHVYESPKFDRDSVYSAPERITAGSLTSSYFDLDPGVTLQPNNRKGNR